MKRAEDFREAFGPADAGFEDAVQHTLNRIMLDERKPRHGVLRRFLVPVLAAVLVLGLGIGIATAPDHWGITNWLSENRQHKSRFSEEPVQPTAEPFMAPIDTEYAAITVREVQSDGYGIYLSVAFRPKSDDVLIYDWSINPFRDSPEKIGIEPDSESQTINEWARARGYSSLVRAMLVSAECSPEAMPREKWGTDESMIEYLDEQGKKAKISSGGGITLDGVAVGPGFNSLIANTSFLEEDNTTVIMLAGGCIDSLEEYRIYWNLIPWHFLSGLENPEGASPEETEAFLKETGQQEGYFSVRFPDTVHHDTVILAEYAGTTGSKASPGEEIPVTLQLIRTGLNDYYRIRCADPERSFSNPLIEWEPAAWKDNKIRFGDTGIIVRSVQENDGMLTFTAGTRFTEEEFPDKLVIVWFTPGDHSADTDTVVLVNAGPGQ